MMKEIRDLWKFAVPEPNDMTQKDYEETPHEQEKKEILGHLPSLQGNRVLELGAGIGRFTGFLAQGASHVTAVDLAPQLIEKNQSTHQSLTNIDYIISDAMDLSFKQDSFDMIFINWLFMYLDDEEVSTLFKRIHSWLRNGGTFFFRESTFRTERFEKKKISGVYRDLNEYTFLAQAYFSIIKHDIVVSYLLQCKLTNQHFWLCQKN